MTAEKCACVFCEALIAQWPPRHCQWCYDNCTMACDMEDPEGNVAPDPRRKLLHKVGFAMLERENVTRWMSPSRIRDLEKTLPTW